MEVVIDEVSRTYGLVPRPDWPEIAARFLGDLARDRRATMDELVSDPVRVEAVARALVGHLTIGETYFLRHPGHFDALAEHVAALLRETDRDIVVWCAGCSTGEEAYSVAVAIAEVAGVGSLRRVRLDATDVNPAAIARALAGRYREWSFRDAPPWLRQRYFQVVEAGVWRLEPAILGAVAFGIAATATRAATIAAASVDVVLFRNVGIYLARDAVDHIFDEAARVLRPGGMLIVAPGDPRPRTRFEMTPEPSTSVYRLQTTPSVVVPVVPAQAARTPRRTVAQTPVTPRPRRVEPPPPSVRPVPSVVASARSLADAGDLEGALQMLDPHAVDPESCMLRAQVLVELGRSQAAVRELRRLTFLAPGHHLGRYWYAVALEAAGHVPAAVSQVRSVVASLESVPESHLVEDGSTTAGELVGAARLLLGRLA